MSTNGGWELHTPCRVAAACSHFILRVPDEAVLTFRQEKVKPSQERRS
jgi:hypothetical protein